MRAPAKFHHPPPGWRVVLVAGVLAVPGALAGAMVGLFVGAPAVCSAAGGVAGALFGSWMEGDRAEES